MNDIGINCRRYKIKEKNTLGKITFINGIPQVNNFNKSFLLYLRSVEM